MESCHQRIGHVPLQVSEDSSESLAPGQYAHDLDSRQSQRSMKVSEDCRWETGRKENRLLDVDFEHFESGVWLDRLLRLIVVVVLLLLGFPMISSLRRIFDTLWLIELHCGLHLVSKPKR